jgi:hypothetical protein
LGMIIICGRDSARPACLPSDLAEQVMTLPDFEIVAMTGCSV